MKVAGLCGFVLVFHVAFIAGAAGLRWLSSRLLAVAGFRLDQDGSAAA